MPNPEQLLLSPEDIRRLAKAEAKYTPETWTEIYLDQLERISIEGTEAVRDIEPYHLEIIMYAQRCRCMLTSVELRVPTADDVEAYGNHEDWFDSLNSTSKQFAATLVRVDQTLAWDIGNLVFMANPWAVSYCLYRDRTAFWEAIGNIINRMNIGGFKVLTERELSSIWLERMISDGYQQHIE